MTTKDGHVAASGEVHQPLPTLEWLRAWGTTAGGYATLWFVASRVWLLGATAVGAHLVYPAVLSQPERVPLWQTWRQWDADIYAHIATQGYLPAEAHSTPAFFPLFPLAERVFAPIFGGDAYLAGLVIANVAWLVALVELYRLTEADFGTAAARGAVLALSVFPTAFFGFVAYPEALFLALAIASLRQMRRRQWLRAALLGMLAALTRQAGFLLILPFVWEAWTPSLAAAIATDTDGQLTNPQASRQVGHIFRARERILRDTPLALHRWGMGWLAGPILFALLIPLGTMSYALWLWRVVGDPLAFWHAQATWHRTIAWPWQTLWLGLRAIGTQPSRYFMLRAIQEWLTVVGMGVLAVVGVRRAPRSYALFAIPLYLLFLIQLAPVWPLLSQGRFMLEVFPLFAVLGGLVARHVWLRNALVVVGVALQVGFIIVFAHGGWII